MRKWTQQSKPNSVPLTITLTHILNSLVLLINVQFWNTLCILYDFITVEWDILKNGVVNVWENLTFFLYYILCMMFILLSVAWKILGMIVSFKAVSLVLRTERRKKCKHLLATGIEFIWCSKCTQTSQK